MKTNSMQITNRNENGNRRHDLDMIVQTLPGMDLALVIPMPNSQKVSFEESLLIGDPGGIFAVLDREAGSDVVVDCVNIPLACSALLGFFVRLWKRALAHDRRIAFFNVSTQLLQEFDTLNLRRFWPVYRTKHDACSHTNHRWRSQGT